MIDKITGAGVVHFSPANTSAAFDTYDDKGLYFRTSPSDCLQGKVIGNLRVEDGFKNVAILARQDAYGEALAQQAEKTIKEQGANVAAKVLYNADADELHRRGQQGRRSKPDAIVLVAFNETTKIVPELSRQGLRPGQDVQNYFVDGNIADYSQGLPEGHLTGVKATFPAPADGRLQRRHAGGRPRPQGLHLRSAVLRRRRC